MITNNELVSCIKQAVEEFSNKSYIKNMNMINPDSVHYKNWGTLPPFRNYVPVWGVIFDKEAYKLHFTNKYNQDILDQ